MPEILRSNYGLTIYRSLICERPLDTIASLCWSSDDLGLTRIHKVGSDMFMGRREAERAAEERGIAKSDVPSYFTWVPALDGKRGVAREKWLRERYWPGREQTINYTLNAALQAYPEATAEVARALTGLSMKSAQWVEIKAENTIRSYIGMPDIVLVDEASQEILVMEIKSGGGKTRYNLDQHMKYLALTALLSSQAFFPGFRVRTLLVGPKPELRQNVQGLAQVLTDTGNDQPVFATGAHRCEPTAGASVIADQITTRLADLDRICPRANIGQQVDFRLYFAHWQRFFDACPAGAFRDNMNFMLPHLLGSFS